MASNELPRESVLDTVPQTTASETNLLGTPISNHRKHPSKESVSENSKRMRPLRRRSRRRNRKSQKNGMGHVREETHPGRYQALLSPESQTTVNYEDTSSSFCVNVKMKNKMNQFTPTTQSLQQRRKLSRHNIQHFQKHTPRRMTNASTTALPKSERTIILDRNSDQDGGCDGIELEYKDGSIALTHVMASHQVDENYIARNNVFVDSGHTVPVEWKAGWNIHYHPICDFHANHRFQNANNCSHSFTMPTATMPSSSSDSAYGTFNHVNMLRKYDVASELELLSREIKNLNREIHVVEMNMDYINNNRRPFYRPCFSSCCEESYWNADEELRLDLPKRNVRKHKFPQYRLHSMGDVLDNHKGEKIRYLQERRGMYFTALFSDPAVCINFTEKANHKSTKAIDGTRGVHKKFLDCDTQLFGLEKVGAMSPSIRSIAVTKNDNGGVGFFLSQDDGNIYGESNILERIKARIGLESKSKQKSIKYLSLGPRGSYFVELISGETLWAIGKHDEQFSTVMNTSRVHRVAFGEFCDDSSWIICTKDGTVVWRNIPLLLEKVLKQRVDGAPAPCEVSLGETGTYFIRFMNGEIKYCLPSYADQICRRIVDAGSSITSIHMHPEVMDAIIIRHTELIEK